MSVGAIVLPMPPAGASPELLRWAGELKGSLETILLEMQRAQTAMTELAPLAHAPTAPTRGWRLYVDSTDSNKLKAIATTGTVVTLGTP